MMKKILLAIFFCFISSFAQNDSTTAPKPEYDVVVKMEPVEQPQTIDAGVDVAPKKGNWLLMTTCGIALWDAVTLLLMASYEDEAKNAFDEAKKDFVTKEEYEEQRKEIKENQKWRDIWRTQFFIASGLLLLSSVAYVSFYF